MSPPPTIITLSQVIVFAAGVICSSKRRVDDSKTSLSTTPPHGFPEFEISFFNTSLKNDVKQLEANQLAEEEEQEMGNGNACVGESSQPRLR